MEEKKASSEDREPNWRDTVENERPHAIHINPMPFFVMHQAVNPSVILLAKHRKDVQVQKYHGIKLTPLCRKL